jgi:NTE family protein
MSEAEGETTNVAIACQGGGSHTAFTAGALMRLLEDWAANDYELVGISGTSGGAFNALATWYGLMTGTPEDAIDLLDAVWDSLAATGPVDGWTNQMVRSISKLRSTGMPMLDVTPYQNPTSGEGKRRIETALESQIDFERIPELCTTDAPELVVGTVNLNAGEFETFVNEEVTTEAVLASAAVPDLFEAVEINGHYHWDGLFSQNPPVSDLMHAPVDRKPEELWIIQINPQEFEGEPTSREVIDDRRNELSGNISLNQELAFIERVNDWIETGKLPADEFTHTEIRKLEIGTRYHCSTKSDRDPAFIQELIDLGAERADAFLDRTL